MRLTVDGRAVAVSSAAVLNHVPQVVLDTNVVLDWLVFRDPRVRLLARRIQHGRLHWLASPKMRDELACVLARASLQRWAPDAEAALACFDTLATLHPNAATHPPHALRCTDPDDQAFIDLAVEHRVLWLVTRDRALLALARAARSQGVAVLTPERWQAQQAEAA